QEPGEDDPLQQRLHGARPRQTGAGGPHRRHRGGKEGRRHRALGAARLHFAADAAGRAGDGSARAEAPDPDRRRGHQPQVRLAHDDLAQRDIFDCLDLIELYKLQWGVKVKSREMYQKLIADEFAVRRHELQEECIRNGWLTPKVIYGYFPCSGKGNDVTVLDASTRKPTWTFKFPRKLEEPRKCLADYLSEDDVVAFQAVTVGDRATQLCAQWEAAGEVTKSYFLHGLAVETAEALAEYWHRRVRAE